MASYRESLGHAGIFPKFVQPTRSRRRDEGARYYFYCHRLFALHKSFWREHFTLFVVIDSCGLVALKAAGRVAADYFSRQAVKPTQQEQADQ